MIETTQEERLAEEFESMKHNNYTPEYQINGLKARSSQIVDIPIYLRDPEEIPGFYDHF